eukprot:scaffold150011_cov30-Tisochrysis_lutea.AAC.6
MLCGGASLCRQVGEAHAVKSTLVEPVVRATLLAELWRWPCFLHVAREFESLVLKHASSYQAGNGLSHKASIGPLASAMQRDIVHSHVTAAIASGARCLLGGQMPSKAQRGNFYPPTVLVDVPHSAKQITQEETFGPVVAIST